MVDNFSKTRDFKEIDFIELFIYTLIENGITAIEKDEMGDRLYSYKEDLHSDELKRKIDLDDGMNYIDGIGFMYWNSYGTDTLHVGKTGDGWKSYIEKNHPESNRLLMQELVSKYKSKIERGQKRKI